jgi:hypothetical protein
MMKKTMLVLLCLLLTGGIAFADWDPGDGHKMHYPQLPDPNGWDVHATVIADDWQCTETGFVTDIHFWGSWKDDDVGSIFWVDIGILSDDSSGGSSKPGSLLWSYREHNPTVRLYGQGDQGWYFPGPGYEENDHLNFYQYNIENIPEPFVQQEGTKYWLQILFLTGADDWGWKTSSSDLFGSDAYCAIYDVLNPPPEIVFDELHDPISGDSLDMAFVITGEPVPIPGAVWLLGSGLIGLLGFRWKYAKSKEHQQ